MIFGKPINELSFVEAVLLQAAALAFFIVVIDLTKSLIKRVKSFFEKWTRRIIRETRWKIRDRKRSRQWKR